MQTEDIRDYSDVRAMLDQLAEELNVGSSRTLAVPVQGYVEGRKQATPVRDTVYDRTLATMNAVFSQGGESDFSDDMTGYQRFDARESISPAEEMSIRTPWLSHAVKAIASGGYFAEGKFEKPATYEGLMKDEMNEDESEAVRTPWARNLLRGLLNGGYFIDEPNLTDEALERIGESGLTIAYTLRDLVNGRLVSDLSSLVRKNLPSVPRFLNRESKEKA
jgi:hypothetical protein